MGISFYQPINKGGVMKRIPVMGWRRLTVFIGLYLIFFPLSAGAAAPVELRWGVEMEVKSLEPGFEANNWERVLMPNLYDPLVFPDPEKTVKPWIAESWQISPDGKSYTFKLRKGVRFHDGSEVTADDVVFSVERMMATGGQTATYFKAIKPGTTKKIDDYTVQFNLDKRNPAFLQALFIFWIVNKDLVMKNLETGPHGAFGDYGKKFLDTRDAGSGPYRAVSLKHGDSVVIERFPDYTFEQWKPEGKRVDRVKMYIRPEWVTLTAMFKKGELDIVSWGMPAATQRNIRKDDRFVFFEAAMPVPWYLIMNNKKPPLDDVNVRKAISYVFDYETVIKRILTGGKRSRGPVPDTFPSWNPETKMYVRDLEKAKAYIKKSKYTPDQLKGFTLDIAAVSGSERFKKIALLAASNLSEIGLNGKVKPMRWTDICEAQVKPETAAALVVCYQSAKVPHAQDYLVFYTPDVWHTPVPAGGMYYDNPKATALIDIAKDALDVEEQNKAYKEAQILIAEDAPSLFLHYTVRSWPRWRYIKEIPWPVGSIFYETRFIRWEMDTADSYYKKNHK
jgi:peptide/nickel transport system substrate-binding protein